MNAANVPSRRLEPDPYFMCINPVLIILVISLLASSVNAAQYVCGSKAFFPANTNFTAYIEDSDLVSAITVQLDKETQISSFTPLDQQTIQDQPFSIDSNSLNTVKAGKITFSKSGALRVRHNKNDENDYYFLEQDENQMLPINGLQPDGDKVQVKFKSWPDKHTVTKPGDGSNIDKLPKGTEVQLIAQNLKQFDFKLAEGNYFYRTIASDHPAKLQIDTLRTSPEGTFTVTLRDFKTDFNKRQFTACVRPADTKEKYYYHRITDLEIIKADNKGAVLALALPEEIKNIKGFTPSKLATPIHLQIVSTIENPNPDDPKIIITEQKYYMGSPTWSLIIATIAVLFTYLLPLWFLRQQRQSITLHSGLNFGLFRIVKNTTLRTSEEQVAAIKPMNIYPPAWFSPLWLGRARRGGASLSSIQITTWTYLVFFVAAYVFILNGQLIDIPNQILVLLGISGAGSVAARVTANRQDERAELIITARSDNNRGELLKKLPFPAWSDLIMTRGQVDLPRLQMLVFTLLTAAYVGITAMVTFEFPVVPDGLLWLMGISNGLYVMGKASEPSLADKLAQADLQRRTAVRDRESKEAEIGTITTKLDNSKKDLQQLEKQLPGTTDATEQKALKGQIEQLQEIIKKLEDELNKANAALKTARKEELELDKKYKEILNNLNQAIEKESETA